MVIRLKGTVHIGLTSCISIWVPTRFNAHPVKCFSSLLRAGQINQAHVADTAPAREDLSIPIEQAQTVVARQDLPQMACAPSKDGILDNSISTLGDVRHLLEARLPAPCGSRSISTSREFQSQLLFLDLGFGNGAEVTV